MKDKVGIYCRLSDEDRYKKDKSDDSESIANQKSMLLKYALNQNWEVINVYSDDDWSGADINRPQFQRLIEDCKNGVINIVLCKTQSRFSRDMEIVERYIHNKFIEWGVRFVSIVDNADTEVQGNKKARQINGLINEWYLEDLSDNIRSSLQNKREDGLYLGSFAPYGYVKDPNNKNKLLVDPVAAEVVKEIFSLYKAGVGYYKIAQTLNEKGIPTPTNYKKENGSKYVCRAAKFKEKTKWSQDTIARLLRNEVYIGNLVQGRTTYVSYKNHRSISKPKDQWTYSYGTHEAIIDIDTWKVVQEKFKKRTRTSRSTGEVYMLSKKVYCKECGSVFNRQLYHTKDGKVPYLKCKSRKLASRDCENKESIRCEILEKYILEEINKQLDIYYSLDELEKNYILQKKSLNTAVLTKRETFEKEKSDIEEKLAKKNEHYKSLYEDKLEGIISQEEFIMFREKFTQEMENYKKRIEIINEELNNIKSQEENVKTSKEIFEKYRHIDKLTKEIVDEFVDVVQVGKINKIDNSRDIDIHLNIINLS